jgi:peptide/nickel transport system permease protein
MKRYILVRIFYAIILLAGTMVITFIMVRIAPGDPIRAAMQQNLDLRDEKIIAQVREQYGLDRPIPVQFKIWFTNFIIGDWGISLSTGEKVTDMFVRRLPVTLELFVLTTIWTWILGIPLGVISALRRNSWLDFFITGVSIVGISIPVFWEAIVLIYVFAVILKVLPPSGYIPFFEDPIQNLLYVAMPTFVMSTQIAGSLARYLRSSLLEVLGHDYIRTARAKGFRERMVILKHAAKPSMIPILTLVGMSWGGIMAGAFIIEFMFAIPGLGRMGLDAVFNRDFPVIQAIVVVSAINVLIANLLTDIAYGFLDPRVRVQK